MRNSNPVWTITKTPCQLGACLLEADELAPSVCCCCCCSCSPIHKVAKTANEENIPLGTRDLGVETSVVAATALIIANNRQATPNEGGCVAVAVAASCLLQLATLAPAAAAAAATTTWSSKRQK